MGLALKSLEDLLPEIDYLQDHLTSRDDVQYLADGQKIGST